MDRLAKEYNRFLVEEAPEQLEEIIFSKFLNKWLVLNHTKNGDTPGVTVMHDAESLAESFLSVIAYHAVENDEFETANILKQLELVQSAIRKYSEFLSEYMEISDEVLNKICSDIIESIYR